MTVELRGATVDDVPTIARLIRALSVYEKLEHDVVMTEEKLRDNLFGAHRYAEVVLAQEDRVSIGFALFFHNFSTFLGQPGIYLEDLFVDPEKRGHGVGRQLLAHLAQLAVERNCGRLEWSVLNWNRDAIGFYERLGAHPNSEWTVYRLAGQALHELAGQ